MSNLPILLILIDCIICRASRILFVPAHNAASHAKSMYIVADVMKKAGHEVAVLQLVDNLEIGSSRNTLGIPDHVILAVPQTPFPEEKEDFRFFGKFAWTTPPILPLVFYAAYKVNAGVCSDIMINDKTKLELEKVLNETWDAIVMDNFTPLCSILAIRHNPKTVLVDFATMLLFKTSIDAKGALVPLSLGNLFEDPSFDYAHFGHRLNCVFHNLQVDVIVWVMDKVVSYWLGPAGLGHISIRQIHEDSSFAVTSVPNGLDFTNPRTLDLGEFDNTCATGHNLPRQFGEFMEDPSSEGTILLAMGHLIDWDYAPDTAVHSFVQTFAKLTRYRIIWQFGGKRPLNVTSNVLLHSWVPQAAILNHPTTKLFISHMGYKSMREAVCARVPVVALPMFGDQERNTATAQHRGFALYLDKLNLSPDIVYQTVQRALSDEQYANAVRRLQSQMEDRIRNASTLFAFQLEFFMRRNKEQVFKKYIKTKWRKLHWSSRWWNGDTALVWAALIGCLCKIVI